MVNVRKRNGRKEKFDRQKLKTSLVNAGASEEDASYVADTIAGRVIEGFDTTEIKTQATKELNNFNREVAENYRAFIPPVDVE